MTIDYVNRTMNAHNPNIPVKPGRIVMSERTNPSPLEFDITSWLGLDEDSTLVTIDAGEQYKDLVRSSQSMTKTALARRPSPSTS